MTNIYIYIYISFSHPIKKIKLCTLIRVFFHQNRDQFKHFTIIFLRV